MVGSGRERPETVGTGNSAGVIRDTDQFAQNTEFEFQFDTVYSGFQGGLINVVTGILDGDKSEIHEDTGKVNHDQLNHNFAAIPLGVEFEHFVRFPDIQTGDDKFLHEETGNLYPLHDIVCSGERGDVAGCVGTVGQDGSRNMEEDNVGDDKTKNEAQEGGALENEMQARVQNKGLAGDHRPPANGDQGSGQPELTGETEEFHEEPDGVRQNADGGDQHTPEIEAAITFEGDEDE